MSADAVRSGLGHTPAATETGNAGIALLRTPASRYLDAALEAHELGIGAVTRMDEILESVARWWHDEE